MGVVLAEPNSTFLTQFYDEYPKHFDRRWPWAFTTRYLGEYYRKQFQVGYRHRWAVPWSIFSTDIGTVGTFEKNYRISVPKYFFQEISVGPGTRYFLRDNFEILTNMFSKIHVNYSLILILAIVDIF